MSRSDLRRESAHTAAGALVPAAEYLRMSTDHQQYSIDYQAAMIRLYAATRGFEIVRTYADPGRSGLSLDGRPSLREMLADVQSGDAGFKAVLVYDVSRWGRFQDPDEGATYELSCRRAGVAVHYCGEQFENDGSVSSAIIKAVKRAMAAEYSRELSVKVFAGQARLAGLGFRQGGRSVIGLRRLLIDERGNPKCVLESGQHKSIATDRVSLVPGPASEVALVREIFRLYVEEGLGMKLIVRHLNAIGMTVEGRHWTLQMVRDLLKNESYVGHAVWAKTSIKLQQPTIRNPPERWVRCDNAYEPIIKQEVFDSAQTIIEKRAAVRSEEELLEWLRDVLAQEGKLSGKIIARHAGPSEQGITFRLGSLANAYALVGYTAKHANRYLAVRNKIKEERPEITAAFVRTLHSFGLSAVYVPERDRIVIDRGVIALFVVHHIVNRKGESRWPLRLDKMQWRGALDADMVLVQRLTTSNDAVLDYYALPHTAFHLAPRGFDRYNFEKLERYRHDGLRREIFTRDLDQNELCLEMPA